MFRCRCSAFDSWVRSQIKRCRPKRHEKTAQGRFLRCIVLTAGLAGSRRQTTLAMDWQTWSMFLLLSAATHMRPVSVPYTPNSVRRRTIWSLVRPE